MTRLASYLGRALCALSLTLVYLWPANAAASPIKSQASAQSTQINPSHPSLKTDRLAASQLDQAKPRLSPVQTRTEQQSCLQICDMEYLKGHQSCIAIVSALAPKTRQVNIQTSIAPLQIEDCNRAASLGIRQCQSECSSVIAAP